MIEKSAISAMPDKEYESIITNIRQWTKNSRDVARDQRRMGCWPISPVTIAFVIATSWLILVGVRAESYQGRTISFAIAGVCGLMSLRWGIIDRKTCMSLASTPEGAVRLFASCIRHGRFNRALALIVPSNREIEEPFVPHFESIPTVSPPVRFRSDYGFKRYLECFWISGSGQTRGVLLHEISIMPESEGVVVAEVDVGFSSYSDNVLLWLLSSVLFGLLFNVVVVFILAQFKTKTESLKWRKRLVKGENNLWYFCNAAWRGPGDP